MHNLDESEGQTTFIEVGSDSAWHRLGLLNEPAASALEAWQRIRKPMVEKIPLYMFDGEGRLHPSRFYSIARTDGPAWRTVNATVAEYATVTRDYYHLSPMDFVLALDQASSGRSVKTMGLLKSGYMFATYQLPDRPIAGEEARWYASAVNDMSARGCNLFVETPVLFVCRNTMMAGIDAATYLMKISHNSDAMKLMVDEFVRCFGQAEERQGKIVDELEILAARTMTKEEAIDAVVVAAPLPKEPMESEAKAWDETKRRVYESALLTALARQQTILDLYNGKMKGYDEYPNRRGTAWAMLQAVVQAYEHEIPARNSQDRASSFLAGTRQVVVAATYKKLMQLCK